VIQAAQGFGFGGRSILGTFLGFLPNGFEDIR
jgi:hypothetical protein